VKAVRGNGKIVLKGRTFTGENDMANLTSTIRNRDLDNGVQVKVKSGKLAKKFPLDKDSYENVSGPEGETFSYARKARIEDITDDEFDAYSVKLGYGKDVTFGADTDGRTP
jgi:hypothetical protein